jgi:hypothetical protein
MMNSKPYLLTSGASFLLLPPFATAPGDPGDGASTEGGDSTTRQRADLKPTSAAVPVLSNARRDHASNF